ncbi:MAG: cytochrome c biogenesis protein CcsA [Longilinea sp.]|jgi:heme exporter protein C|nr:cytochrome c biogenesis protein CcsA [Longilinea sp.]HQF62885.1 cytochrome c biogenesis protein CcsA [Anaerolineaceae bacterium]HQH84801.1 cytochrome c biogenesis protein CcsA [Anaerolineaceae bacterium]
MEQSEIHPGQRTQRILDIAAALAVLGALAVVIFYAPLEATMGAVQKIFYFHLSAAWAGMLSFMIAAIAGGIYLARRQTRWDQLSLSAVEVGLVLMLMAIVGGSIWARQAWNTWWTWDPRLTTVTIMELVYLAYFLLRQGVDDPERRARFGAVYAVVGFLSVPLMYLSIHLYRTIHPLLLGSSASDGMQLAPRMTQTLLISLAAFSVLLAALLYRRVRLARLADTLDALRQQMD